MTNNDASVCHMTMLWRLLQTDDEYL